MKDKPKIVAITGAESTGKSALAKTLAEYYNTPFIPEYAREYVQNLNRKYTYDDVEIIARKQVEELQNLKKLNHPIIILDTWLVITKIWFKVVFNRYPEWIEDEIMNTEIDLFLVCDTDLPWVADNVRENAGDKRKSLQKMYIEELEKYGFPYRIVKGEGKSRTENAIQFINKLL